MQSRPVKARLLLIVSAPLSLGTLAAAVGLLRLRCEGFGCIGIGIAWMAWAGLLAAPALLVGIWAYRAQAPRTAQRRLAASLVAALGLALLALLGAWLRAR